jgi:hypothetical protein
MFSVPPLAPYAPIEPGDILIELNQVAPRSSDMQKDVISKTAGHAILYRGTYDGGLYKEYAHAIAHSNVPSHDVARKMVRVHELEKMFNPEETALGSVLVLRIKEPAVRKALAQQENIRAETQFKTGNITPYSAPFGRRADTPKCAADDAQRHLALLEFFRAFRIYQRIAEGRQLSKNKGVSCIDFVLYMLKAAIIQTLFPAGLPSAAIAALAKIEQSRIAEKHKKLDQVNIQELETFERLIKEQCVIHSAKDSALSQLTFQELYRPVKTKEPVDFCRSVLANPMLWEAGYLFISGSEGPCMMSHALYCVYQPQDSLYCSTARLNAAINNRNDTDPAPPNLA